MDLLYRRGLSANALLKKGIWLANRPSIWRPSKGQQVQKITIDSVPAELLVSDDGMDDHIIFHLHGGGYVVGLMDLYRFAASKYSKISGGAKVLTIDYRTAPEHVYPAALEDTEKAWDWLINNGYKEEKIIVIGDSAGGNLAVSLLMKLRDKGRKLPKALITLSPWLDITASGSSYHTHRFRDPIFGIKKEEDDLFEIHSFLADYFIHHNLTHPYISPIYGEFTNFPNTLIQVGTEELLLSDAMTFYEKAKEANVNITLTTYEGMFHDFQILTSFLPESKKAWEEIEAFIKTQWNIT